MGSVTTDIILYSYTLTNVDKELEEIVNDNTPAGALLRIMKEASLWKIIENKKKKMLDRLEAIETLRRCSWGNICRKIDDLLKVMRRFPMIEDPNELSMVLQCVSIVILELDLREQESNILENKE